MALNRDLIVNINGELLHRDTSSVVNATSAFMNTDCIEDLAQRTQRARRH